MPSFRGCRTCWVRPRVPSSGKPRTDSPGPGPLRTVDRIRGTERRWLRAQDRFVGQGRLESCRVGCARRQRGRSGASGQRGHRADRLLRWPLRRRGGRGMARGVGVGPSSSPDPDQVRRVIRAVRLRHPGYEPALARCHGFALRDRGEPPGSQPVRGSRAVVAARP